MLDTRTPPRVKLHKRRDKIEEPVENSHAGIAVPIDEDSIVLEEATKKMHFYKVDKPTTDSGLSTWILLSGQTASPTSTTKGSRKPVVKHGNSENKNMTLVVTDAVHKNAKPMFNKKRPSTTRKPSPTMTSKITTKLTTFITTPLPEKTTKLTKIKASVLNHAINNKTKPLNLITTTKRTTISTTITAPTTTSKPKSKINNTMELVKVSDSSNSIESSKLPLEAKIGGIELGNISTTTVNPKKSRRPNNKRKKNKNRRKRPHIDKNDNSTNTKVVAHQKEKPIGTQIYNYLSREVMPTVGVGLVGLMVTAGLASYFLYPFGSLRRSYEVDRRDKDNSYYYNNDYSGGIAEEDAIGKVIAGMPSISNYYNYLTKNNYPSTASATTTNGLNQNSRYRQVDHRFTQPQGSVEKVKVSLDNYNNEEITVQDMYVPHKTYNSHYKKEMLDENKNNKFVVGNVPQDYINEATPAAVPEHGPRNLKIRRKRYVDDIDNEIPTDDVIIKEPQSTTSKVTTTTLKPEITTRNSTHVITQHKVSFIELFKDLLQMKIKMGLELLQNSTRTLSKYISQVQKRLDEHQKHS